MLYSFILTLGDEMDRRLVLVLRQMSVNTVVTSIELATDKPIPEGWITGVQGLFPILVPIQQVCVLLKTFGKILQAEPIVNSLIRHVCLGNKFRRRIIISFLLPVHGNSRF